jgi:hypothetical protein
MVSVCGGGAVAALLRSGFSPWGAPYGSFSLHGLKLVICVVTSNTSLGPAAGQLLRAP